MRSLRPTTKDTASSLLMLEEEDRRLHEHMHRARIRRNVIQDMMTRLRLSLTSEQRERYEAGKWLKSKA